METDAVMKFLNKLFAPAKKTAVGEARGFFTWDNWPVLLGILLVLALVVGIVYIIRKRRTSQLAQKAEQPAKPEKKRSPQGLPVIRLRKVWKGFLNQIPWDLRRAVMVFQHFIVVGEAGAGKTALIDNHTDWQGHARQFYPSYTANPLLQIYLGSKVLVQEIPASLLNDTSKNARLALVKLWKPLFRRKDPIVVAVINGATLQTDDPEHLKKEAQVIRGKINLLARIRKKPITVRLALTNMDQFEGFTSFATFLRQHNLPFKLELSTQADMASLERCLEPYEEHLTRALTTLPPEKYLRAITFLRRAPRLFQHLSTFMDILDKPDPLSPEPDIASVNLSSQASGTPVGATPFATSLTAKELQKFNPLFKHRIIATVIGIVGLVFLATVFFYEHHLVKERYQEMATIEADPPAQYDDTMHQLFLDPITRMQKQTLMAILPDFFPHINRELDQRCIENIRKFYLNPELERFSYDYAGPGDWTSPLKEVRDLRRQHVHEIEGAQDKAIYLLGLIYATRNNGLGKLIRKHLTDWSDILGFSSQLIDDYINNNESSWDVSLDIEKLAYRPKQNIADDPHAWMVYFSKISGFYQQSVLTRTDFDKLRQEAGYFLNVIQELERYDLSVRVTDLLKKESPLGLDLTLLARRDSQIRQEAVKNFLSFIKDSNIDYPKVTDELTLAGLHENLKVMLHFHGIGGEEERLLHFLFGGEEFKFSARKWNELLNRSRITFFMRDFIRHNKHHDGMLFFSSEKEFDDITLNASNDGQFLFTGQATVDGRFTKDALENRVKPLLTELPEFITNLPIPDKEKSYFANFLFKEVEAYGSRYADAYRDFYMAFDIEADSLGALRYALTQLTLPSSQFMDVFLTVKDNTIIDPGNNEYLKALSMKLARFEFFQRLMDEQKGAFPELDKYKTLLQQMQMDIDQPGATGEADEEDPLKLFKDRLTPLARTSFAIFRDDPDSYLNLVRGWLKSVGITSQWQNVFLSPVYHAYYLGLDEIEAQIAEVWETLWQADVFPLQGKFPFANASDTDVTLEMLKNAAHPHGHFWQTFHRLLAPICIEADGRWRQRSCTLGVPELPERLLPTVNTLATLTQTLWDADGQEQPLSFMIKPAPLPRARAHEPIAVLAYLHAGESSVFGFNQQPAWQKFSYEWQFKSPAAVGVEFTDKKKEEKFQAAVTVPKSSWSFYHLLQKTEDFAFIEKFYDSSSEAESAWSFASSESPGAARGYHILTWIVEPPGPDKEMKQKKSTKKRSRTLPVPERRTEGRGLNIKFGIQTDPWALFKLPR